MIENPCKPSPCGPYSNCRAQNNHAVCSCLANYIGAPPNCRAECMSSSECPQDKACYNERCKDPCPGTCGQNANCRVINHNPICTCLSGFTGDPFVQCVYEESKKIWRSSTIYIDAVYPFLEPLPRYPYIILLFYILLSVIFVSTIHIFLYLFLFFFYVFVFALFCISYVYLSLVYDACKYLLQMAGFSNDYLRKIFGNNNVLHRVHIYETIQNLLQGYPLILAYRLLAVPTRIVVHHRIPMSNQFAPVYPIILAEHHSVVQNAPRVQNVDRITPALINVVRILVRARVVHLPHAL